MATDQLPSTCLALKLVARYVHDTLGATERERADKHFGTCAACQRILQQTRLALVQSGDLAVGKNTVDSVNDQPGQSIPRAPLLPGAFIGRYQIEYLLGSGGMGVVYAAMDSDLQRMVALKCVRVTYADNERFEQAQDRLIREARAMAALHHSNVVVVYDVGKFEDQVFVAMQLVDGNNLRVWLAEKPRAQTEKMRVLIEAGQGLVAAHAISLVHRDLKPDNILISRHGTARLTDFGISRRNDIVITASGVAHNDAGRRSRPLVLEGSDTLGLTHAGAVMGTPAYMAPEQAAGEETTAQSDQFSFAVTAWEVLFGERPFAGMTAAEIQSNILQQNVMRPSQVLVAPDVEKALRRSLDPDPAARFPHVRDLVAIFAAHASAAPMAVEPVRRWRNRPFIAAGATLLAVAGMAIGFYVVRNRGDATGPIAPQIASATPQVGPASTITITALAAEPPLVPIAKVNDVAPTKAPSTGSAAGARKHNGKPPTTPEATSPLANGLDPAAAPDTAEPLPAVVEPVPPAVDPRLEQARHRRDLVIKKLASQGVYLLDTPDVSATIVKLNAALDQSDADGADLLATEVEQRAGNVAINAQFVDAKFKRVNAAVSTAQISPADKLALAGNLRQVMTAYTEQRFNDANRWLNEIRQKLKK